MLCRLAALSLLAITFPGCTTYITQVQAQEEGGEDASSFPASAAYDPDMSTGDEGSTSTGEEPADTSSTSGEESSSTGAVDSTTGSTGESTTTGELDSTTTGEPSEASTGTTGEPAPVLLPHGAMCVTDEDCVSGVCIGHKLNTADQDGPNARCSVPCSPDTANDCSSNGYPGGLCMWGGGDQHYCIGSFVPNPFYHDATPPLPGPDYYHDNSFAASPDTRHIYLIPAWATAYYIETGAVNGNGNGPIVYDLLSSAGNLIATHEMGDKPIIEPEGVNGYHWMIVRTAPGVEKSLYHLFLKNTYWPNANP